MVMKKKVIAAQIGSMTGSLLIAAQIPVFSKKNGEKTKKAQKMRGKNFNFVNPVPKVKYKTLAALCNYFFSKK